MYTESHFEILARYNRIANERLLEACEQLDDEEYRKKRPGSFGSIHGLLNHVLLGDRIWMARFEGMGRDTPPLDTVLFDKFCDLKEARIQEDIRIEKFFSTADETVLGHSISYVDSKGREKTEFAPVAIIHFFNHQTHHRGQIHVMLSQTPVAPPSFDLHRIINP